MTAKEAQQLADAALEYQMQPRKWELLDILEEIRKKAENGWYELLLPDYLENYLCKELELLGFSTRHLRTQIGPITAIKWYSPK